MKILRDKNNYIFYNDNFRKSELEVKKLYDAIEKKEYETIDILKDDNRSFVVLIDINKKKYVLKVPREKNRRKWQRFISIIRGGQASREFKQLEKLEKNDFNCPIPFLAVEKKKFQMTCDSYFLSEYIKSREATIDDLKIVTECLDKIHEKGFLHGDSQLTNFLVKDFESENKTENKEKNKKIYLIDAKLSKNIYGKFGEKYEYIYLQESCSIDIKDYVDRNNFYFKAAKLLNSYLHFWGRVRKKLKNKG